MFVSFNSPQNIPNQAITTLNIAEEGGGGGYQPPGTVTTQAIGEEGGGGGYQPPGTVTTQAIGEEGGGAAPPPNGNIQTADALQVLQKADKGGYYGQGDGQLTTQELNQFSSNLERQIPMLKAFDQYFPWLGLGSVISGMEKQLEAAHFMGENFNNISNADGQSGTMTANDIKGTAKRDGNANDISQADISGVATTLALGEEGGGADNPQQTLELMRLQQKWDTTGRDGQLSRAEVLNASDQLADRLKDLKNLRTRGSQPTAQVAAAIERTSKELAGINLMKNNFDSIAQADANRGGQDNQISIFDILISAARDGNIFELDPAELPPAYVVDLPPPPMFTTLALGEEGGGAF